MMAEVMSEIVCGKNFALNVFNDGEQRSRIAADMKLQEERVISLSGLLSAWFPCTQTLLKLLP